MNSSHGAIHLNVEGSAFKDVIGALALASLDKAKGWAHMSAQSADPHRELVDWVSKSPERREAWVISQVLRITSCGDFRASKTSSRSVSASVAPLCDDEPEWFAREMAFLESPELASLVEAVADDARAALARKLPAKLSPDLADGWARGLAASLR